MEYLRVYTAQGSKIRSSYIAFAQKEKKRLEGVIHESAQEIVVREKEVARLKGEGFILCTLSQSNIQQTSPIAPSLCQPLLLNARRNHVSRQAPQLYLSLIYVYSFL